MAVELESAVADYNKGEKNDPPFGVENARAATYLSLADWRHTDE